MIYSLATLIEDAAAMAEVPRPVAARVLAAAGDLAAAALTAGHDVRLPGGLGILRIAEQRARAGTAPDGSRWTRPAGRTVRLRPSRQLRRLMAREAM